MKPGFFRSTLILTNIVVIVGYLITCLIPFINTSKYWFLALPGLVFPVILFALICFIILWIFLKSKWWLVSLVVLLLGFQQITSVLAFSLPNQDIDITNPGMLRVMQWNASNWGQDNQTGIRGHNYSAEMFELIHEQDPDILCVEEYFDSYLKNDFKPNLKSLIKIGYPYYYIIPSITFGNGYHSGIGIFSKFPILDSGKIAYNPGDITEHLLYVDVKIKDQIVRVFATHLQSVKFESDDYWNISRIKRASKPSLSGSKSIISKLKRAYKLRYDQATLASNKIKESPYPAIVCGDFNDVPNSTTYFKMRGDLHDAFIKKGWGIGRTFVYISPTLRIDYILTDKSFKVKRFDIIHVPYSVHYPLITDLEF